MQPIDEGTGIWGVSPKLFCSWTGHHSVAGRIQTSYRHSHLAYIDIYGQFYTFVFVEREAKCTLVRSPVNCTSHLNKRHLTLTFTPKQRFHPIISREGKGRTLQMRSSVSVVKASNMVPFIFFLLDETTI